MVVLEVVKEGVGMVVEASTGSKEDPVPQHLQDIHVTTYCTADTPLLHWEFRG